MQEPIATGHAATEIEITARLRVDLPVQDLLEDGDSRPDLPITPAATSVVAFVGRTLKGPVNEPLRIATFAQYQQHFGGLWQPSALSYAVEQFFDNGGEDAVIVRVVSNGRPPTMDLPADDDVLVLTGRCPGSREYLRASVDYDGIDAHDPELFNLVVQRLRTPGSELVEEQEIFRRLSIDPRAARSVVAVLATSRLVRVLGATPAVRPDISAGDGRSFIGYVNCNADGDDGQPLSDYDIIGAEEARSGLFALSGGPAFSFLCIPPLSRDQDVGMSTLVVAARFCRQHHAMLLVDPPSNWTDAAVAIANLANWPFHSQDAVMYFPRVVAMDRLRGRTEIFASCGVAAGLLARADRLAPLWSPPAAAEMLLRPGIAPACEIDPVQRRLLSEAGVNALTAAAVADAQACPPRTLGGSLMTASDCRLLSARRLALFLCASIERGTHWVVFGHNNARSRERVRAQVTALLQGLVDEGAFVANEAGDDYFVVCDERLNNAVQIAAGEFRLLYGYAALRPGDFHAWLVTHRPGGSQTRAVSVNRFATVGQRVEVEIETAILRGLTGGFPESSAR